MKYARQIQLFLWGNCTFLGHILQLKSRAENALFKGSISRYFTNGEKEQPLLKITVQVQK